MWFWSMSIHVASAVSQVISPAPPPSWKSCTLGIVPYPSTPVASAMRPPGSRTGVERVLLHGTDQTTTPVRPSTLSRLAESSAPPNAYEAVYTPGGAPGETGGDTATPPKNPSPAGLSVDHAGEGGLVALTG